MNTAPSMNDQQRTGLSAQNDCAHSDLIAALSELIDALDRRVAHVERAGESGIAADAAMLRRKAVARIEELKGAVSLARCASQP
jgi:hypothetical protein